MFGYLQKIGKSLMLPVATLPAAGILMALGILLQNESLLETIPFMKTDGFQLLATVMADTGNIIFGNLPLLFAIAVVIGLTNNDGTSALSGVISYLMINMSINAFLGITPEMVAADGQAYATILGIPTLQTGVFGGIIAGLIGAWCYNTFYQIELPDYLGFFSGKRFVPMVTAVVSIVAGFVLTLVWPQFQQLLTAFSQTVIDTNLTFAAGIFGIVERLLIPFGLHHVFYAPFWFQFGEYMSADGTLIFGDQSIFFQQMREGADFTAGAFMTGKFPFMMFGLPAGALAMYHTAEDKKKKLAGGILLSAALTSFLTGITEPIEFTFLFLAPGLFVIHSLFAGISFALMNLLNVKIGMTLSGGLIDYILFGVIPNNTSWWLVIPVGLIFSFLYYFTFKWYILRFNVPTPGRDKTDKVANIADNFDKTTISWNVLDALGGLSNIKSVDACITRLRMELYDNSAVDKPRLAELGAMGVVAVGSGLQVIFGAKAQVYSNEINYIMKENSARPDDLVKIDEIEGDEKALIFDAQIFSPVSGDIIPITEVNDPVFSQKMMGEGFAVQPEMDDNIVHSPVEGEVISLFPTNHAIGLRTSCGLELIVHIGLDTVKLNGKGFKPLIAIGQMVKVGEPLVEVNYQILEEYKKDPLVVVVFTNLSDENVELQYTGNRKHAEDIIVDFNLAYS